MEDNNNKDQYEKVCYVCRRPESKAGDMITMPGGICMCHDCLQRTMDTAIRMTGGDFSNLPGLTGMDPNLLGMNFGMSGNTGTGKPSGNEVIPAEGSGQEEGTDTPEDPEKTDPPQEGRQEQKDQQRRDKREKR